MDGFSDQAKENWNVTLSNFPLRDWFLILYDGSLESKLGLNGTEFVESAVYRDAIAQIVFSTSLSLSYHQEYWIDYRKQNYLE